MTVTTTSAIMGKGLPQRIKRHAPVLQALRRLNNNARLSVMGSAKKELIATLVACARAIINRAVRLTERQTNEIRRHATSIRELLRSRATIAQRRKTLQTGGFLGALLGPILGLLPKLFGA